MPGLREDLLAGRIVKARIFFVSYETLTRTSLTPELLQRTAEVERAVEMNEPRRTALLAALERTTATPLDSPPDLRWGALFYDADAHQLHSIYLNGKRASGAGREGIIDGRLVKLNGALVEWFEQDRLTRAVDDIRTAVEIGMSRAAAESALDRLGIGHSYVTKEEIGRFHLDDDVTAHDPRLQGRIVAIVRDVEQTASSSTSLSIEVDMESQGRVSAVRVRPQITAP